MKTMLKVLSLAALIAASAPLALATPITQGGAAVVPSTTTAAAATSGTLVGTASGTMSPGTFTATWTESVYRNATGESAIAGCGPTAGCLDFVFNFTNVSGDALELAAQNLMGGLLIDAAVYGSGPTVVSPGNVNESPSGVVNWNFTSPNFVIAGDSSATLVLYTNALGTQAGFFSLHDGTGGQAADLAPTLTPEPSSLMLLGTGLMTVVGVARRKFKA